MLSILIDFALGNKRIVPLETTKPPRVALGTAVANHIASKLPGFLDEQRCKNQRDRAQQFDENVE